MKLHTIDTGFFKLDGGAMFGVVPKAIWNKTNPADDKNLCTWAMRCLLIEDGKRLILIDTGIGNKQDEKFFSHYYLHGNATMDSSLAAKGFHRDDITDVFLTHLHFDHVGGAVIRDGEKLLPAFKNATYWSNRQHWEWAVNPNDREKASFLKDNILPIQQSGRLKFVSAQDGVSFTDDIKIKFAYGHTDAMMLPLINYKGKQVLYMADLLPSAGHVPLPYVMAYDMFPMKTLDERKIYWNEAVEQQYILYMEHDPVNECCTLQQTEKGIRIKDLFKLEEM
ncbi:MBL fold metallo-hydrolase [Mucilaginibacter phyllosphaerae]|uniref:Glyoxylase-like metal-dependent hydrolase (Beta-lactamase superfamily II) n=1 Tax=Mucilaginibacter phyllosphaerae TaxID=1812349 RepID=A0A4Y8ABN2_9SPHI|nr:MBL fold metallo-hydrolase [Mucilaginibacter phyllosphaerae]MBB3969268.1 glyoxylase-like metal-dependent hydrolase (beta-lactamase superfamily II) [Mucilaginibacter phyllosphaerae]TEW65933.1 MBL fold metallo-hydrolase [Mucilaginibacter phyllosphaerae]GGH07331.1 MBL fold metallo-hydrolase [Mucilaginibacter phyllosphaerae]